MERSQGTWCREWIALPAKNPYATPTEAAELIDQRRLADTSLTSNEDEAAFSIGGIDQPSIERSKVRITFKQFHPSTIGG